MKSQIMDRLSLKYLEIIVIYNFFLSLLPHFLTGVQISLPIIVQTQTDTAQHMQYTDYNRNFHFVCIQKHDLV